MFKAGSCMMICILYFYSSGFSLWLRSHKSMTVSRAPLYLLGEGVLRNKGIFFFYIVWKFNIIIAMIDMRDARSAGTVKSFIRIIEAVGKDTNFWYSTFSIVPSMYSFKNVYRWLQLSNTGEIASLLVKYSKWWHTQQCQMWEIKKARKGGWRKKRKL